MRRRLRTAVHAVQAAVQVSNGHPPGARTSATLRRVHVRFADIHAVAWESGWRGAATCFRTASCPHSERGPRPLRPGDVLVAINGVELGTRLKYERCLDVLRAATAGGRSPELTFVSLACFHQFRGAGGGFLAPEEEGQQQQQQQDEEQDDDEQPAPEYTANLNALRRASAYLTAHATQSARGLFSEPAELSATLRDLFDEGQDFALERLLRPAEHEHAVAASQLLLRCLQRLPGQLLNSRERAALLADDADMAAVVRDMNPARQGCLLQLLALVRRLRQRFDLPVEALARYVMAKPRAAVLEALVEHYDALQPAPLLLEPLAAGAAALEAAQARGESFLQAPLRSRGACAPLRSALLSLDPAGPELAAALAAAPAHDLVSAVMHLLDDDLHPLVPGFVAPELAALWDERRWVEPGARLFALRSALHALPAPQLAVLARLARLLHRCAAADEQLAAQLSGMLVYNPTRHRRAAGLERRKSGSGFLVHSSAPAYRSLAVDSLTTAVLRHSRYLFGPLRPVSVGAFGALHAESGAWRVEGDVPGSWSLRGASLRGAASRGSLLRGWGGSVPVDSSDSNDSGADERAEGAEEGAEEAKEQAAAEESDHTREQLDSGEREGEDQ